MKHYAAPRRTGHRVEQVARQCETTLRRNDAACQLTSATGVANTNRAPSWAVAQLRRNDAAGEQMSRTGVANTHGQGVDL